MLRPRSNCSPRRSPRLVRETRRDVEWLVCPAARRDAMATAETKVRVGEFANEPFLDFTKPENRSAMEAALKKVASEFGREYPMYIGGKAVITTAKLTSTNPSHPKQVLGVFQSASAEQAGEA